MRRYPRKPHHHTSQIRYALNLSNLLLLINRPPPTGRLEHLSYTENRVLRQLTLRTPFPQVPILSLELTPRTLSTITSPIFSKFVLELGKKNFLPNSLGFLGNIGAAGTRSTSLFEDRFALERDEFRLVIRTGKPYDRGGGTFQTHAKASFPFPARRGCVLFETSLIRLIDTGVRCIGRQRIGT